MRWQDRWMIDDRLMFWKILHFRWNKLSAKWQNIDIRPIAAIFVEEWANNAPFAVFILFAPRFALYDRRSVFLRFER